ALNIMNTGLPEFRKHAGVFDKRHDGDFLVFVNLAYQVAQCFGLSTTALQLLGKRSINFDVLRRYMFERTEWIEGAAEVADAAIASQCSDLSRKGFCDI